MASFKLEVASISTVLSTELNSLANAAGAISSAYDNDTNLYLWAMFELNVTFGSAPTAYNTIDVYLVPAPDGTNYDDAVTGASGYAPSTGFVGGFPLRAVTSAQKVPLGVVRRIDLPPTKFKVFVLNSSGQAFPASGSTVKMTVYRYQSV